MRDFKGYVPSRLQKIETMADMPKEKRCNECKFMKPNTFEFFGKKWHKTRTNYVTVDVCNECKKAKIANSMRAKWADRRRADQALSEELVKRVELAKENVDPGPPEGAKPVDPADTKRVIGSGDPFDWK